MGVVYLFIRDTPPGVGNAHGGFIWYLLELHAPGVTFTVFHSMLKGLHPDGRHLFFLVGTSIVLKDGVYRSLRRVFWSFWVLKMADNGVVSDGSDIDYEGSEVGGNVGRTSRSISSESHLEE